MNPRVSSTERICTTGLSEKQLGAFSDKLYDLTMHIFGGGDKQEFEEMVSKCPSDDSRYLIYKNANNEWVGYFGLHRFTRRIDGETATVFRAQAGLLPEYRRTNASLFFPLKEIVKFKLKHPLNHLYAFVAIINPSMYYLTDRYVHRIYPSEHRHIPDHAVHIVEACAKQFNFRVKPGDTFWARTIGWYPVHTPKEEQFWNTTSNPRIQYYRRVNPDFLKGKGLLTLVPLSGFNILISTSLFFYYAMKKKIKFAIKQAKPSSR